jgi:hypothetical protein
VIRVDLIKKITFEPRLERRKGVQYENVHEKAVPGKGNHQQRL